MSTDEDLEFVRLCQGGRTEAFEALVKRHQKRMLNVAVRMIGDYDEACEVVQDAFLSAYRAIRKFKGEAKFSTWLCSIVINLCKNRLRQRRARLSREGHSIGNPSQEGDCLDPPAREPAVLEQLEEKELQEKVQECIGRLGEEYREVLVLRDVQGFSYEEICDTLQIPQGTVKSRLFRARNTLKDLLKKALGGI